LTPVVVTVQTCPWLPLFQNIGVMVAIAVPAVLFTALTAQVPYVTVAGLL